MAHHSKPDWTFLHDRLHRTIRQRQLFQKHQRLLVAVSGGQDSLCLIQLLLDLQPQWNWTIAIAHCNHQWRPDANANANHVAQLAQTWEIPCFLTTADLPPASEAAARDWRYDALTKIALTDQYSAIVTGHTASDRAETLLYNLIRGSGTDGLPALAWKRELTPGVQLVRPLLELTRSETAQFCKDAALPIWEDSTNQDDRYARNRIRHQLLPYLQTHFNPQVEQAIARTAEILRAEVDYLESITQEFYDRATVQPDSTDSPRINRQILQTVPIAIQRRVIRQWLIRHLPIAPNFDQIEKVTALIHAPNRSRTDPFPGGAIAQVQNDWIVLSQSP